MTIEAQLRSERMTGVACAPIQDRVRTATRRAHPDQTITTS